MALGLGRLPLARLKMQGILNGPPMLPGNTTTGLRENFSGFGKSCQKKHYLPQRRGGTEKGLLENN